MNKKEKLVAAITVMSTLMTKEFEQIGLINQIVQTPLRQANRKLSEIADLVDFTKFKKSETEKTEINTDQQERQIGWKTAECKELATAYADLSEAMREATGKSPFENDWTRGIVSAITNLG